jgi:hypothetical protein
VSSGRLATLARGAATFAIRCAFVLVLFEGAASLVLFTLELPQTIDAPSADRVHTRHDPELGWTHVRDLRRLDHFGPGRHLTIDAAGFRNPAPGAEAGPAALRVVCSGSEATFGTGVGDAATWCAQLGAPTSGLTTFNLGRSGYGLGQTYLAYLSDARPLEHAAQLLAISRLDFSRMQARRWQFRSKPVVRLRDGALQTENVPVPASPYRTSWISANASALTHLRAVQLVQPVVRSLAPAAEGALTTGELADLSIAIFEELSSLHDDRGSRLVIAYLPAPGDYDAPHDLWRRRIRNAARSLGIQFVDLVDELKSLPRRDVTSLFRADRRGDPEFSEAGHAWIARTLLAHLRARPGLVPSAGP